MPKVTSVALVTQDLYDEDLGVEGELDLQRMVDRIGTAATCMRSIT